MLTHVNGIKIVTLKISPLENVQGFLNLFHTIFNQNVPDIL